MLLWGIGLILLAVVLAWWGYTLPRRRTTSDKEADIVAYYLDMAMHFPTALWIIILALLLLISGVVVVIKSLV